MIRSRGLAVVIASLVLIGCQDLRPETASPVQVAPQSFVDPVSDTSITVSLGSAFDVVLTSNPTTGYYWYQIDGDSTVVQQAAETYIADPAPEGIAGSGGRQKFEFNAVGVGRTTLHLSYQRHDDDVAETTFLNVEVAE